MPACAVTSILRAAIGQAHQLTQGPSISHLGSGMKHDIDPTAGLDQCFAVGESCRSLITVV